MTAEHGREKSILAIVEGRKREPALMKAMLDKFGISERYRIVSFETVVYQLFSYLDACGGPEEAELVDVLRDLNAGDEEKLRLLEGPFTDVVLVFDFDPQDDRYDEGALRRYAEAFCDSTDSGLLFINYPSVESYRDFEALGDASFVDERVAFVGGGVGGRGYKEYVAERRNGLDDVAHIDALQWARIIAMHVSKAQHLLEGKGVEDCAYWAPSCDLAAEATGVDLRMLLDFEIKALGTGGVYPLCTCVLFICSWARSINGVWKKASGR